MPAESIYHRYVIIRLTISVPLRCPAFWAATPLPTNDAAATRRSLILISPLLTGATYFVRVNEAAIARANNSPTFMSIPPIYICANEQFIFDQSAIDPDGDSLVYQLSTPFNGGTFGNPQPIPTFNPPYDTIIWKQGFSRLNMLGVGQPLRINRFTGLTRALPQALGQYVVGVRIIEYDRLTGRHAVDHPPRLSV